MKFDGRKDEPKLSTKAQPQHRERAKKTKKQHGGIENERVIS